MDSNAIYYFEFQTCNLDLQPAYNISKLTIQILWCSNQTIKALVQLNLQTNIHKTQSALSFTRLWDFHAIIKKTKFPLHPSLIRYHRNGNIWAKFRIYKMSVPELPYSVSARPLDCLRKTTKLIENLRSNLNKLHERNQFMYNYMVEQLQNIKLHIQP